jgi:general secretion pathway protein D
MKHSRFSAICALCLLFSGMAQATPPQPLGDIQLTQVRLEDVARLIAQVGEANVVVTSAVLDRVVSVYLRNARVEDMVRNVCRAAGVWYRLDAESNTYIIMSAEEYQKDLAIVRDEKTQVFTLRHHNVVAAANAIKGLFGTRVALANPVEEMPPVSLGAGDRMRTGGGAQGRGGAFGGRGGAGGWGGTGDAFGGTGDALGGAGGGRGGRGGWGGAFGGAGGAGGAAGGSVGAAAADPRADLERLSPERIAAQTQLDDKGQPVVGAGGIQDLAARLGPPIYVTYNRLNNLLMVRSGDTQAMRHIQQLVADMDRPPRQVLLEMKILEVALDDGYRSVFDFGQSGQRTTGGPGGWGASNSRGIDRRNSLGAGRFAIEQDATLIWQTMSESLSLRLQLLANENKLKTLASPMVVAANNQPARLFIGDERILTVGASSQSVTGTTGATQTTVTVETEKRDIGQTLSILPRINGDRTISLTVDQDSSTVKIGDATIPISTNDGLINFPIDTVNTANLQVTAHAKDGMTVAIGGMIREDLRRDEQKVPLLGDIPGLGFFFKRDVRAMVRSQIILLITPRVIESPEEADAIAQTHTRDQDELAARVPQGPVVPKPAGLRAAPEAPAAPSTPGGAVPPGPTSALPPEGARATYADLARAAARAVRAEPGAAPAGLRPTGVATASFRLDHALEAQPVASWQRDDLHVTALRVINLADRPAALPATAIRGRWAAMVVEKPRLDAATGADSWSWVYAISRLPFDEALERAR